MLDDRSMSDGANATAMLPTPRSGLIRSVVHRLAGDPPELPVEGHLPTLGGATGWLNSDPLTPEGLRGRVVLVDFWTYTCINWLRTAPYVRAWDAKYRDMGLTVIGVHTPEFGFEGNVDNVVARTRGFKVDYPVAIDTDYGVWQAFANHFWPAVYIADAEGRIRYHHFGEGEYAMTEMVVQQLLIDAGAEGVDPELVTVEPEGFEVAADWSSLRTPETYVSFGRSAGFASPAPARYDEPYDYPEPSPLGLNQWAPVGRWTLARRPLLVGAVHGLAGSGALTALVMATMPTVEARLIYLALFGVGSTLGMAALSGLLGWPIARVGAHGAVARGVSLTVGCISILLGVYWGYPLISRLY